MFDLQEPGATLLAFAALWVAIVLLLSRWSGWSALADRYRGELRTPEGRWYFQSASMRWMTNYNSILTVSAGDEGLSLSILFPFRFGHPPLLIPWNQIVASNDRVLFFDYVTISFRGAPGIVVKIRKRLSQRIAGVSHGRWEACFA